jgi:transcriptional regulator with XRE-family HTH domain
MDDDVVPESPVDDDLVPGSLVRRWRLGRTLRQLREAAGKTMEDAARYIDLQRPTISRIENGRHAILPRNVKQLCQLYEVGAPAVDMLVRQAVESNERGWWPAFSDTMPDWFETFVAFEADAKEIWAYESEHVPGLLQIPAHVRALRSAEGSANDDDLAKSVEFRLARQSRLSTKPPRLRAVLNEAVVRRQVGSADDMAAQLQHLTDLGRESWAEIQVLPFSVGPHPGMRGSFSMLTLPGQHDPNFVYQEFVNGAVYLERPTDLAEYAGRFEQMTRMALSPGETQDYLVTLVEEYLGE